MSNATRDEPQQQRKQQPAVASVLLGEDASDQVRHGPATEEELVGVTTAVGVDVLRGRVRLGGAVVDLLRGRGRLREGAKRGGVGRITAMRRTVVVEVAVRRRPLHVLIGKVNCHVLNCY